MTTPVIPTLCSLCANIIGFDDNGSLCCKAFPDGVPSDILSGQFDHRFSHSKDNGILFDPNISEKIIKEGPFKETYVKPIDLYKNNSIKLNYNCPDSEKIGSGPGSCSGGLKSIDELEPEELDAISDYTRGLSNQISSLLVDGKLNDYEEPTNADPDVSPTRATWNLIETLDKAIESSKPLKPGTYYHGIDDESKYVEGEEFNYLTFMSVTNDIKTASDFGYQENDEYSNHVLKINIPEGMKGIEVSPEYSGSDFPDMEESILPRNIKLKVGKSYIEGNTKITDVDVVSIENDDNEIKDNSVKLNYKCKKGAKNSDTNECPDNEDSIYKKQEKDVSKKAKNTSGKKVNLKDIEDEFKSKLNIKNINLRRISAKNSRVILDTLNEENSKMPIALEGIDNSPKIKGAGAALEPIENGRYVLHISARHIEKEKNRDDASDYDGRIREYETAISDLNIQLDNVPKDNALTRYKIHKLIKEHEGEIRNLLDKKKSGEKFVPQLVKYKLNGDDRTRAEVLHEIGHYRRFNMDDELNDEIDNAFKNTDDFPSRYSRKNSDEWFSEQYVLYGMGMKHHPVVDSVMNKQLKKIKLV